MMYRYVLIISLMMIFSGFGLTNVSKGLPFSVHNDGTYCLIDLPETTLRYNDGYPILPVITKTYTYPPGTRIQNISVNALSAESYSLSKKIAPSPPIFPLGLTDEKISVEAKEGYIYQEDVFYPQSWYEASVNMGLYEGERMVIVTLQLAPILYNPIKNKVLYARDFDVVIDVNLPTQTLYADNNYDLLIITPEKWVDKLDLLRQHKDSYGIRTLIWTTENIYANYWGRDDAEDIKYAIRNAIEQEGITYVLFVGDAGTIPVRQSYVNDGYETSFPSDAYYADIYFADGTFSSWDSNENDYFGEYRYEGKTDDVDLYPDVALGRLACSDDADVDTAIAKIVTYESSAFGTPWFNTIVACGGDTFTSANGDNSGVFEGERINQLVLNALPSFSEVKLWASLGTLSTSAISSSINEGAGFVDFSGHGSRTSWATHPPDGGEYEWIGAVTTTTASSLTNSNKLPIVILDACSCGKFDRGDCLAWSFVKNSGGGAIATLSASGLGYGIMGEPEQGVLGWMECRFFTEYASGTHILGDIWVSSLEGYLNTFRSNRNAADIKTVQEWIILGDPTLKIGGYGTGQPIVYIDQPMKGYLYFNGRSLMKTFSGETKIIGDIVFTASAYNVQYVEFYCDGDLKYIDSEAPYEWMFDERALGTRTISVIGYGDEYQAEDETTVRIFHL